MRNEVLAAVSARDRHSPRQRAGHQCFRQATGGADVDYPPGAKSLPHRHAGSAFIYAHVLSGDIRSAVNDEPARVYRPGEGWFEKPGAHHVISENASDTKPARLLAIFLVDETDKQLTTPDGP